MLIHLTKVYLPWFIMKNYGAHDIYYILQLNKELNHPFPFGLLIDFDMTYSILLVDLVSCCFPNQTVDHKMFSSTIEINTFLAFPLA